MPASPVVVDFIAGKGAHAVKTLQGYGLTASAGDQSGGEGHLRIYNFSDRPISGRLDLGSLAQASGAQTVDATLAPGEMREVPVALVLVEREFRPHEWTVTFVASTSGVPPSVFSAFLYPDASRMNRVVLETLAAASAGAANGEILATRPLAREEPPDTTAGRWRVTQGVSVTEREGVWSFSVTGFPAEPLRPAIAELVLPDGFALPEHSLFELEYRLTSRAESSISPVREPRMPMAASAVSKEAMGVYWRTANGNLYTVWQTPPATTTWQRYAQAKASFTMGFYGRANLPWRFSENKLASLVFQFRPNYLPATFEVRKVEVTRYAR